MVGAIATAVNRRLDGTPLIDELRSSAYTAGIDFTHEWSNRAWSLNGYFTASHIAGEAVVIEDAQRSSARYYQRPDADHLSIDPTATSLRDYAAELEPEPDGYRIDPDGAGPAAAFFVEREDFNIRSLRGNAVLRWQWRPGSTIFLVWQQTRSGELDRGDFDFGRDSRALFRSRPDNVFVVKLNYWLSP